MISKEDISKLSALSRIDIDEGEKEKLAKDMESIVSYIGQLNEVEINSENSKKEKSENRNVLREDVQVSDFSSKDTLNKSPKLKDGFVVVKKIL